ncbi:hypothetical protein [Aquincola tertiaricarbonis]|uniref:hypothetical protein n=1 Tax=Aquincola tertiaricarbonis TaxID=391953 RepID=UPI0006151F8F|nr:hypothetical protein [Aquincola tertiaricarbonis]
MSVSCKPLAAALVASIAVMASTARADSVVSSASSAGSASSGSVSDSIQGSSRSSGGDDRVAEGDYRIVAVAAAERPGRLRLTLQAEATPGPQGRFQLELPQQAVQPAGLVQGDLVHARHRPYGVQFARVDNRQPFFLVLADTWHGELASRPVPL